MTTSPVHYMGMRREYRFWRQHFGRIRSWRMANGTRHAANKHGRLVPRHHGQ